MALFTGAIAGVFAFSPPARASTWYGGLFGPDAYTDYGQGAYKTPPSTKVAWFTTVPVVIAPAAIVPAPDLAYAAASPPPPMVVEETVVVNDAY